MAKVYKKRAKKSATPTKGVNALNDPEERRRFRRVLDLICEAEDRIATEREVIKETIADLFQLYGVDKTVIKQMVRAMMNRNYSDIQEKNTNFEIAYETIIEGGLRSPIPDPSDEPDEYDF